MARTRPAKPTALSLAKAVAFSSVIHTDFIVSNSNLKVKCRVRNVCKRQVLGCLETCIRALLMVRRACFDQGIWAQLNTKQILLQSCGA